MVHSQLEYLFHHIFLPSRVPHFDDSQNGAGDRALAGLLARWAASFRNLNLTKYYQQWSTLCRTLRSFESLHCEGKLSRGTLEKAVSDIRDRGILILHIATQNSGLIIRRESDEYVIESFEASPPAKEVLAAQKALVWDFPSRSVAVPISTFEDTSFQSCFLEFLERASIEPVKEFAATTRKAGLLAFESRDTSTPAIVGQLLLALLEANGRRYTTVLTRKRIRDDVCWSDGAENPWRRSPAWMVLRIGLQRSLCNMLGERIGTLQYKFFICYVHAMVSEELSVDDAVPIDHLSFARTKLARRMAKIQQHRIEAMPQVSEAIDFENIIDQTLRRVNATLTQRWSNIRTRATKRVLPLPRRADPASTVLSLSNSRAYLHAILDEVRYGKPIVYFQPQRRVRRSANPSTWAKITQRGDMSWSDYLDLSEMEARLALDQLMSEAVWEELSSDEGCVELMQRFRNYEKVASFAYNSDPEQLSLMLITLFEIWQKLDSMALVRYPLLADYPTGFPSDILHPLCLPHLADMHRLQNIERYLESRSRSVRFPSCPIFSDPQRESFPIRYFDECQEMQSAFADIKSADEDAIMMKAQELVAKSSEYDSLLKQAAETNCIYVEDRLDPWMRLHDDRRCKKCYLQRQARRMRIQIHEALLPWEAVRAKAVVFELLIPQGFAAWRDTTWQFLQMARRATIQAQIPCVTIRDYKSLTPYSNETDCIISLASTKKSNLETHYANVPFPTTLERICFNHNPEYKWYDSERGIWTSQHQEKSTFADMCSQSLPPKSIYASLYKQLHPTFQGRVVTGNEIVASQTRCPNTLTVGEYTAFQDLRLGCAVPWIRLLRELASSNLNFGVLEVGSLVTSLAHTAGPPRDESPLRATHWVFEDPMFCQSLCAQIKVRLESIAVNWREGLTLECLSNVLQRIWSLSSKSESAKMAETLLLYVRSLTHEWIKLLRREVCNAMDVETGQKRSRDALLAALLCRKTFIIEAVNGSELDVDALACFLECAFTVKSNLSTDAGCLAKLPTHIRRLFIRDIKILQRLETKLQELIPTHQVAISRAVNSVWAEAGGESRSFSTWILLEDGWVTAKTKKVYGLLEQSLHLNLFEGSLLVDGQALGQLPEEYTKQDFFKQFFGDRVFLTYRSSLPGMSYMLAVAFEEHQIHFGLRNGTPFMRARFFDKILELIPSGVFHSIHPDEMSDLPKPLIDDYVHWLDLSDISVELRPRATMWRSKLSDWKIDLQTNRAFRRFSRLVDPRSAVFRQVADLIEPFESRNSMILFQPQKKNLTLHLPRLELEFTVNYQGLLESRRLKATISTDQDAGTFYGLASSLVLNDLQIPEERSILVGIGMAHVSQGEGHPRISIRNDGFYARFYINKVLGRLECASEPRLIYFKAYCHAITASIRPDPLTGRTGTAEAIHCLQAGNASPWQPLDEFCYRILSSIADLTPKRVYYPKELKVLQKVSWSEKFITGVQHHEFGPVVANIMHHCRVLHQFHLGSLIPPPDCFVGDEHLLTRARARNNSFECIQHEQAKNSAIDHKYIARDCTESRGVRNAYEAAFFVRKWSHRMPVSQNLAILLQDWPLIRGYNEDFELHLLSDLTSIDLAAHWGPLFKLCRTASEDEDKFKLMFLFATMSFGKHSDMVVLRSLIAIAIMAESKSLKLPKAKDFIDFRCGQMPSLESLLQLMRPYKAAYPEDERTELSGMMHSKQRRELEIARRQYEKRAEESCALLANNILRQWPMREPSVGDLEEESLLFVHSEDALLAIQSEWERLVDNRELSEHLLDVQRLLDTCSTTESPIPRNASQNEQDVFRLETISEIRPSIQDLMESLAVSKAFLDDAANIFESESVAPTEDSYMPIAPQSSTRAYIPELQRIVGVFSRSQNPTRKAYGKDLENSISALAKLQYQKAAKGSYMAGRPEITMIERMISSSRAALERFFELIRKTLSDRYKYQEAGGLLPDLTSTTFLELLRTGNELKGMKAVKRIIVRYAEQIIHLQRTLRLRTAMKQNDLIQLSNETRNPGHTAWHTWEYPDWLLLEIDFNLLIRPDQLEVARAMLSPNDKSNFVLQMNMGQGKSSVIIPMIAAVLANAKNLVRVVVPRPLLVQTAHLLQARLGGLIGRKISHVPFSRKSPTEVHSIEMYKNMHSDILNSKGVILTLPEHMLSFKLSGLQELSYGRIDRADLMAKIEVTFGTRCRDILDECDHMLAVKTQLIYPSGSQSIVDGHPYRWTIVQSLLKLVKIHVRHLEAEFPSSVEVITGVPGTFPTIYLLNFDVKEALISRLTDSILRGEGGILPVDDCSQDDLKILSSFLREAQIPKARAVSVDEVFKTQLDARYQVLLLRGLLVHRILLMGLAKRWNVQYGVHPAREPIAVPFRSKGTPSDQAEFGHPDVSILLTCLSFYHSGLTLNQFRQSLIQLLRSDEPVQEFEAWIHDVPSFPNSLGSWNAINIDDEAQCAQLWSFLRQQMTVVNHFLNNFVFPRHAKTFEHKLVSSGWDIATPLLDLSDRTVSSQQNERPRHDASGLTSSKRSSSTVGFSGTNDNKTLLPMNVLQDDLPGLAHTNAEVLTYLLQPRNRRYYAATDNRGKRLSEHSFLHKLHALGIRMLLDAGAQILEMDNLSLAKAWLKVDHEAEASVYFGEDGRARVVYRDGKCQPLVASPYLENLGVCCVYLDEAHCRGVDLKMPASAIAALTLGLMQTKDHTVQAALRLRQLAISQSVVFFAPPEVHQSILNFHQKSARDFLDSADVITWVLEQTCCSIEQLQPLYISQGLEYCRRQLSKKKYPDAIGSKEQRQAFLKLIQQPERYSLEQLYSLNQKPKAKARVPNADKCLEIAGYLKKLDEIKKGLCDAGDAVQALAHQEVEQEREVQIEVEAVREVKKPHHAQPLPQKPLQKAIRIFAMTGRLAAGSYAFQQAFIALQHTTVGQQLGISESALQSKLFVSEDFTNTVITHGRSHDEYSRPVHWILWSPISEAALVVSDYEADALVPLLLGNATPSTHLITYAAPVTRSMVIFDTLKFYTVPCLPKAWRAPPWLVRDLGLFAGRLYFNIGEQGGLVFEALGLSKLMTAYNSTAPEDEASRSLLSDGEGGNEGKEVERKEPFCKTPLLFMQKWLAVRRKGQDFSQTMMGEICRGRRVVSAETSAAEEMTVHTEEVGDDDIENVAEDGEEGLEEEELEEEVEVEEEEDEEEL